MNFEWQETGYFKEKFIVIGDWNLKNLEKFSKCDYISADTETKLYLDDELLTEEKAYELYKIYGAKWCRINIVVKAYAFMISDGENFALFQNIEDFLLCCATMQVKKVFWYNARFDFAIFDYYFATNEWKTTEQLIEKFERWQKLPDKTYQSLNGEFGQRYQLRIWKSYKNSSYHRKVHSFKMIDICNIFQGGLRKNLEDFGIVDKYGKDVRKLHMDYVNASIENDIDYMIADTKGLHLLSIEIDKKVLEISGFSLFKGDYITAGGLAKKSILKFLYGNQSLKENLECFKIDFPMTLDLDSYLRDFKLYKGGKCFVSPYYVGKVVKNIYKFDVNSMYPYQMRNMLYPLGWGKRVKEFSTDKRKIYVVKIKNIYGTLKENMVPVWYDVLTKDYKFSICEHESQLFWKEELDEIANYYEITYEIEEIIEYNGYYSKGMQDYVDTYYKIKKESKGSIRNGAKLFLNSGYGKFAERVDKIECHYELSEEGYIHLVKGEEIIDEKSLMSVLVGSRITALSRTLLMKYIREICKGNPKKYFLYCDTDSVHALCDFKDTDNYALGKMKSEGIYEYGKYLAPKSYMLYHNLENNSYEYEVHTKGVNTEVVKNELLKCKDFETACNIFKSGINFKCLVSLNCIGGKALIYIDKMILNPTMEMKCLEDDEDLD